MEMRINKIFKIILLENHNKKTLKKLFKKNKNNIFRLN